MAKLGPHIKGQLKPEHLTPDWPYRVLQHLDMQEYGFEYAYPVDLCRDPFGEMGTCTEKPGHPGKHRMIYDGLPFTWTR